MDELACLRADPERWSTAVGNVARRLHLDSCEQAARLLEGLAADGDYELVDAIAFGASVHHGHLYWPEENYRSRRG